MTYRDEREADRARIAELEQRLADRETELAHTRAALDVARRAAARAPLDRDDDELSVAPLRRYAWPMAVISGALCLFVLGVGRTSRIGTLMVAAAFFAGAVASMVAERRLRAQRASTLRIDRRGIAVALDGLDTQALPWGGIEDVTVIALGPTAVRLVARTIDGRDVAVEGLWKIAAHELDRRLQPHLRKSDARRVRAAVGTLGEPETAERALDRDAIARRAARER